MLAWLLAASVVTFHAGFETGNVGRVEAIAPAHYRIHVNGETDQDGRNRQASWFHFRVDGAKGQALTLDFVDLAGEYNYQPNRGAIVAGTPPYYSEDGERWRSLADARFDAAQPMLRVRVTPRSDRVWFAHQPPYSFTRLHGLLDSVRANPAVSIAGAGKTLGGREIPLVTITDSSASAAEKKVIWILFRQHAWEAGSSWAAEGAMRFLLSSAPRAAALRRGVIFKIFPMCDPDGVVRGGVRFNAKGFDLNRNWDVSDPRQMPEIEAERKAILDWVDAGNRVDMALTLHNDEAPEYIQGPPGAEFLPLARRFETLLAASPVFASNRALAAAAVSTTIGTPGRMDFGQGLYYHRKLPAFLIELSTLRHPKLGRRPNIQDRIRFGEDLVIAMADAVEAR